MKYILITLLVLTSVCTCYTQTYYYGSSGKVFLEPNYNNIIVSFNDSDLEAKSAAVLKSATPIGSNSYLLNSEYKKDFENSNHVVYMDCSYKLENANVYPTNEIIFSLNNESKSKLEAVCNHYHLIIVKQTKSYIIVKPANKVASIFKLANEMYELSYFDYCYPNFSLESKLLSIIPNDEYFGKQWNLNNTGQTINDGHVCTPNIDINMPEAWEYSQGIGVTVAVIDQGVTSNHIDLPNSRQLRLPSGHFGAGPGDANTLSPSDNLNHGNACAGIIGATMNNGIRIAGVAPLCTIMPIRLDVGVSGTTTDNFAEAINFAIDNNAQIISNSWAFSTVNGDVPAVTQAIKRALDNGVVVVFAVGNDSNTDAPIPPLYPSAADPRILAVAACDRDGNKAIYSNEGTAVDLVAPSHKAYNSQINGEGFEIWTLDIPNEKGYNPCNQNCSNSGGSVNAELPSSGTNYRDFTGRMGGTSAAAPQVAGVAALLLSANPCLTLQNVNDLIESTARKIGNGTYSSNADRPNGTWRSDMGYGLLDAEAALKKLLLRYFQNATETTTKLYSSFKTIEAGREINPNDNVGNYIIANGADVTFKAMESITLKKGFRASAGCRFKAKIEEFDQNCSEWPTVLLDKITPSGVTDNEMKTVEPFNALSETSFSVYPNPSNGNFVIQLQGLNNSDAYISVSDITGKALYQESISINNDSFSKPISLTAGYTGILLVTLKTANFIVTKKLICHE